MQRRDIKVISLSPLKGVVMELKETEINTISIILNTWLGFHNTRRKVKGLSISHCYIILACVWLESLNRPITEGSLRTWLKMYHSSYMSKLVAFLALQEYIVLTRSGERKRYYTLTDKGRQTAIDLLHGIEERQVAFFNKYHSLI